MDYKPGYVSDDHLSRAAVAGRFKRPTRTSFRTNSEMAGSLSVLFGLASDGVYMCPARHRAGGGLLHRLCTLTGVAGGLFLLHWPGSRLHRMLSGILPCEARTFLTCSLSSLQPRSSVHLEFVLYHKSCCFARRFLSLSLANSTDSPLPTPLLCPCRLHCFALANCAALSLPTVLFSLCFPLSAGACTHKNECSTQSEGGSFPLHEITSSADEFPYDGGPRYALRRNCQKII